LNCQIFSQVAVRWNWAFLPAALRPHFGHEMSISNRLKADIKFSSRNGGRVGPCGLTGIRRMMTGSCRSFSRSNDVRQTLRYERIFDFRHASPEFLSMSDRLTPSERGALMAKVRSKNTKPEMIVRRTVHRLGYRFRLHRRDLPGSPDLVLPKHRLAIFVHGCFWHRHPGCRRASTPATNKGKWEEKFERNKARDGRSISELADLGWDVLVIWECETGSKELIASRLTSKLDRARTAQRSVLDKKTTLINKCKQGGML